MSRKRKIVRRAGAGRIRWRKPSLLGVCYYSFCPDAKAWRQEQKRALRRGGVRMSDDYPDSRGMTTSWRSHKTGCLYILVTIRDDRKLPTHIAYEIIAHEAVHVARRVFEEAAENRPGEECEAYMITDIFAKLSRDYRRVRPTKGS